MPDQIVTISEIQRRARKAFMEGAGANACPFPWHSAAYRTWNDEYRRAREETASKTSGGRKAS
jgi:hypothetical protein